MFLQSSSYQIHQALVDDNDDKDACQLVHHQSGTPKYQISCVQSILNVAARVIYGQARFDHVTPTLRDRLHWLRVPERIQFKRCLLVYKALNGPAPTYITEYCTSVPSGRRQRSSCSRDFAFHALQDGRLSVSDPSLSLARAYGTTYRTQ